LAELKRNFFSNISLLLLLNISVKAFWVLGIDRTVQNRVGAEDYGFYFSLFSFSVLFNILLDFGITNYNNRKVSGNPDLLRDLLGNMFLVRIIFALVYMSVSIIVAHFLGYSSSQRSLLYILLGNQFIASFILYLRSNIAGLHLFRIDSLLSVTDRFIMIIVCGLLLWGGFTGSPFRIEWFVYSQSVAYIVTFIVALAVVISKSGIKKVTIIPRQIPLLVKESAPYALLSLFMAVYWRVDSVMLERMLPGGMQVAGVYAQSFRLLDAASMVPYLFAVILLPMFSRAMANNQRVGPLSGFAVMLLVIPASVVTLISVFYPSEIMGLLYHQHIEESASIFRLLMISYVPVSLIYVYSTLLTAGGRLKLMNIVAGTGMIVNIFLNFLLIPGLGAKGSALASMATQIIMAFFFYYFASQRIEGVANVRLMYKIIIYIGLLLGLGFILSGLSVTVIPGSVIMVTASLVFPLITGMVKVPEMLSLWGHERK